MKPTFAFVESIPARICVVGIIFAISIPTGVQWYLQKELRREFSEIISLIEGKPEDIVPLSGRNHIELRSHFILSQIKQAAPPFILFLGDSIIEGLHITSLNKKDVINAGLGGGRLHNALELLEASSRERIEIYGILIAVGVNDTIRRSSLDIGAWETSYNKIIEIAKRLAGNKVALVKIAPTEQGKPLGDLYFDKGKIQSLNRIISKLAKEHDLLLVDYYEAIAEFQETGTGFTTDGVHPTLPSYRILKETILRATAAW